jgi:hypothetical protein
MGKYHQPYSEIKKIPTKLITYLKALAEAENQKLKDDLKDLENKGR